MTLLHILSVKRTNSKHKKMLPMVIHFALHLIRDLASNSIRAQLKVIQSRSGTIYSFTLCHFNATN